MERITDFCGRNERYLWVGILILYLAFIYHNSLTPAAVSSQQSGTVLAMLRSLAAKLGISASGLTEHFVRKSAHFAEFALLGLLLWNCLRSFCLTTPLWVTSEAFMSVLFPLLDETVQLFTEGRSAQVDNVWLDIAGVCAGTLFMVLLWVLFGRGK